MKRGDRVRLVRERFRQDDDLVLVRRFRRIEDVEVELNFDLPDDERLNRRLRLER
jgi:hypothetical protein